MSDEHPTIDDADLGVFTRATTELSDGSVLTHDWYGGSLTHRDSTIELMLEGASVEESRARLPRLRAVISDLDAIQRRASDAVVTSFSQDEPEQHELDDAASDLALEAIEAASDGTIVLHLTDTCGTHFPEGYWPAAHLADDDTITNVTVES
ncbi:hypothetical protein ACFY9N_10435 [Microbacterium sp. NPDC008134]|uniref:hypothetical protein n=1 Tax=Microbacterium sp. NPDC008134 TaxID=3364183 RepID=UPI0036F04CAC